MVRSLAFAFVFLLSATIAAAQDVTAWNDSRFTAPEGLC